MHTWYAKGSGYGHYVPDNTKLLTLLEYVTEPIQVGAIYWLAKIDEKRVPKSNKTEEHHKIPVKMGGSNHDENKIHLPVEDHLRAHVYQSILFDAPQLDAAVLAMTNGNDKARYWNKDTFAEILKNEDLIAEVARARQAAREAHSERMKDNTFGKANKGGTGAGYGNTNASGTRGKKLGNRNAIGNLGGGWNKGKFKTGGTAAEQAERKRVRDKMRGKTSCKCRIPFKCIRVQRKHLVKPRVNVGVLKVGPYKGQHIHPECAAYLVANPELVRRYGNPVPVTRQADQITSFYKMG